MFWIYLRLICISLDPREIWIFYNIQPERISFVLHWFVFWSLVFLYMRDFDDAKTHWLIHIHSPIIRNNKTTAASSIDCTHRHTLEIYDTFLSNSPIFSHLIVSTPYAVSSDYVNPLIIYIYVVCVCVCAGTYGYALIFRFMHR